MIEIMSDLPGNVAGFTARGKVTGDDYERVLIPTVEVKLKAHEKIRLLYYLGADFSGFDAEALWDDAKVGLQHWTAFEKIAVVTDNDWIVRATKVLGFMMPCEVKVFPTQQLPVAQDWVKA